MKWTVETKAIVAERLRAGDTAAQIGARLDVSRSAITGLLNRDKELAAIGFARSGTSFNGGRTPRITPEEKRERQRQYSRAYLQRRRNGSNVVPFPQVRRIVSNNVPLMVDDWLKLNGGPRRFEQGVTTDTWLVRQYLTDRGISVTGTYGKWKIVRGPGRPKTGTWAAVMEIVDEIRLAEGLQPFACRQMA
ncbi:MAG: hypothetical protein E5Y67_12430 [Mesorhizobium sp.]|uniref:hypothetical protein n=1 Tax=Mesorhizobium sp. TaxID=1871066 RepID=UPI00121F549D|nr:hypothetical protein [Mesorhizobium sp.]TIM14479.1 MAG: hypothetical protein E5Y67_12430 [Mesorhizobium sp.]